VWGQWIQKIRVGEGVPNPRLFLDDFPIDQLVAVPLVRQGEEVGLGGGPARLRHGRDDTADAPPRPAWRQGRASRAGLEDEGRRLPLVNVKPPSVAPGRASLARHIK